MAKGQRIYERHGKSIYFKNDDMDFYLQWILGYQVYGGLGIGECFSVASRIKDGDPDSWKSEFYKYGTFQEDVALSLANAGNQGAASKRLFAAFCSYRAASMCASPSGDESKEMILKFEHTFQLAMDYAHILVEPIEVPFENSALPGYFYKSTKAGAMAPLILILGGSDSFREDLYYFGGAEAIRRGYNVAMVDLPGQGRTPNQGLHLRYDMEVPVTATIDWLVAQDRIKSTSIGVYGVSGGGYFAMRAQSFEKRIRAIALSTPIYDMQTVIEKQIPKFLIALTRIKGLLALLDKVASLGVDTYFWRVGADNYGQIIDRQVSKMRVDVGTIDCPILSICGAGESQEIRNQALNFYEEVKKRYPESMYRFYDTNDGAEAHCQVNNFQLAHQELFDWFDSVLS